MAKRVQRPAVVYDERYCDELIEHCRSGYTIESFAARIGTSRASIYNWVKAHEEFEQAHEVGKQALKDRVTKRLHDFADGIINPKNASVVAAIFLAKNLGMRDDTIDIKVDNSNNLTLAYALTNPDDIQKKKEQELDLDED